MSYKPSKTLIRALSDLCAEITEVTLEKNTFTSHDKETYQNLPAFTRIAFTTRPGPGSYILNEIWLPDDWNGTFLGTGNGGLAGHVAHSELDKFIRHGFAVVNTDMGTSGGAVSGCGNPDVHKDFGWRSTVIMTAVGKKITEDFYGRKIERSYFYGASTGGQQALCMAQRCPEEYDGIVAVVPAFARVNLHTYFLWIYRAMKESHILFTEDEVRTITKCAVDFQKKNGFGEERDLFVSHPRGDKEYIDAFLTEVQEKIPTLTNAHMTALSKIYHGPVNPRTGEQIYCGLPMGAEAQYTRYFTNLQTRSPHFYPFLWTFGTDYMEEMFDFDQDLDRVIETVGGNLNATEADLRPFFARGGKLFMFSGSADPVVPFPEAMKYYERMADAVGGKEKLLESARYFLVPGQDHGAQITRYAPARMNGEIEIGYVLDILQKWCEEGIVPDCFDMVTEVNGETVEKTIYAYGTEENPFVEHPTCAVRYLQA